MKKYLAFFKIKFANGLQFRTAAWAGILTQFFWGFMEILAYQAFYGSSQVAVPLTFREMISYIWLQQAFLSLFMLWIWENDLFDMIKNGNIAYELIRPISIYQMWYSRTAGFRLSRAILRCGPILLIATLLPEPFKLYMPQNILTLGSFFVSLCLGFMVVVALNMLIYLLSFYTVDAMGLRMVFQTLGDLLIGSVVPLPFFPPVLRKVAEILPFAAVQNIPFRIYSGNIAGQGVFKAIVFQSLWLVVLVGSGLWLEKRVLTKVVIQGG